MMEFHATTICAVKRGDDDICIGGDGQVTMGKTAIMKNSAIKVRKIAARTRWKFEESSYITCTTLEKRQDEKSGSIDDSNR